MYNGVMALLDTMVSDGILRMRRLERYRMRVQDLIRYQLENKFWTSDRKEILCQSTASLKSFDVSPMDMADQLIQGQIDAR